MSSAVLFSVYLRFFFVLAPFFCLTMFLTLSNGLDVKTRRFKAIKITIAVLLICYILFFIGDPLFKIFGITVDSFRVGAGVLLFLSAIDLVRKNENDNRKMEVQNNDFVIVPMSIPIIVGPAVVGVLMDMGIEVAEKNQVLMGFMGMTFAILSLGVILFSATVIERILKDTGIKILSKLTGLVLSAIAAKMILEGTRNILFANINLP